MARPVDIAHPVQQKNESNVVVYTAALGCFMY